MLSVIFKIIQYLILNRIDKKITNYITNMQQAFEKNRSTQKSIFIRKHMLTVEKHYDKKVKIIEHEVDIASA